MANAMKNVNNKKMIALWTSALTFLIVCLVTIFISLAFFTGKDVMTGTATVIGTTSISWQDESRHTVTHFDIEGELVPGEVFNQTLNLVTSEGFEKSYVKVGVESSIEGSAIQLFDVVSSEPQHWVKSGPYYYYVIAPNEGVGDAGFLGKSVNFATAFKLRGDIGNEVKRKVINLKVTAEVIAIADYPQAFDAWWENAPSSWLAESGKSVAYRTESTKTDLIKIDDDIFHYYSNLDEYGVHDFDAGSKVEITNYGVNDLYVKIDINKKYFNETGTSEVVIDDIVGIKYNAPNFAVDSQGSLYYLGLFESGKTLSIDLISAYIKETSDITSEELGKNFSVSLSATVLPTLEQMKVMFDSNNTVFPKEFSSVVLGKTFNDYFVVKNSIARRLLNITPSFNADEKFTIENKGTSSQVFAIAINPLYYNFNSSIHQARDVKQSEQTARINFVKGDYVYGGDGDQKYYYLGVLSPGQTISLSASDLGINLINTLSTKYFDISISVENHAFDIANKINPFSKQPPNQWFRAVGMHAPQDVAIWANEDANTDYEVCYETEYTLSTHDFAVINYSVDKYAFYLEIQPLCNNSSDVQTVIDNVKLNNTYFYQSTDANLKERYYFLGVLDTNDYIEILRGDIVANSTALEGVEYTLSINLVLYKFDGTNSPFTETMPAVWYRNAGVPLSVDCALIKNGIEYTEQVQISDIATYPVTIKNFGDSPVCFKLTISEGINPITTIISDSHFEDLGVDYKYIGYLSHNETFTLTSAMLSGSITSNTYIVLDYWAYSNNSVIITENNNGVYNYTNGTTNLSNNIVVKNQSKNECYFCIDFSNFELNVDDYYPVEFNLNSSNFVRSGSKYYYLGTLLASQTMTISASTMSLTFPSTQSGVTVKIAPLISSGKVDGTSNPLPNAPKAWSDAMGIDESTSQVNVTSGAIQTLASLPASEQFTFTNSSTTNSVLFYFDYEIWYYNGATKIANGLNLVDITVNGTSFVYDNFALYYYTQVFGAGQTINLSLNYASNGSTMTGVDGFKVIINTVSIAYDSNITVAKNIRKLHSEAPDSVYTAFGTSPEVKFTIVNNTNRREVIQSATGNFDSSETIVVTNEGSSKLVFTVKFLVYYYKGDSTTEIGEGFSGKNYVQILMSDSNFATGTDCYYCNKIVNSGSSITFKPTSFTISNNVIHANIQYEVKVLVTVAEYDGVTNPFESAPSGWFSGLSE